MACTGIEQMRLLLSLSSDLGFEPFTWPHVKTLRWRQLSLLPPMALPKGNPSATILLTLLTAKYM